MNFEAPYDIGLKPATREESEALAGKYANGRGEKCVSLEEVGLAEVALRIVEERAANVATNLASDLPFGDLCRRSNCSLSSPQIAALIRSNHVPIGATYV